MYYENFERLCKVNSVKPADVCRGTGISSATLTSWKKGVYTPKQDKLLLVADFFNVSLDEIVGNDFDTYSDEMAEMVSLIRNDAELSKALSKYFSLSSNKKKHVIDTINILSDK